MQSIDALRGQRYISLETYRRSGQGVRTPVWFAEENGHLFFYSMAASGKVKRLHHDSRVALAPSDARGRVREDAQWLRGHASLLRQEEAVHAQALLVRKYGWQRKFLDLFWILGGCKPRAALEITLD